MTAKYLASAIVALGLTLSGTAFAGSKDYAFEPVQAEVKKGDDVTVAVRLVHKPTGKPVADALIIRTRIDMSPDKMADMASQLTLLPSPEPGIYAFKTELAMQGRWMLSIAAKVQGEPETVIGKVTYRAAR